MRPVAMGERLTLRKPHPCGATTWLVTRVGADIGVRCDGCSRSLLLARRDLAARLR